MKEKILTVTEAARGFSDLVNCVRYRGESATLTKNGRAVARLIPVGPRSISGEELAKKTKLGSFFTPDEADSYARDIEEGRKCRSSRRRKWSTVVASGADSTLRSTPAKLMNPNRHRI